MWEFPFSLNSFLVTFLLTEMSFDYTKNYDFLTPKNALTVTCNLCSAFIKLTRRSKYNVTQHYKFSHETPDAFLGRNKRVTTRKLVTFNKFIPTIILLERGFLYLEQSVPSLNAVTETFKNELRDNFKLLTFV